MSARNLVRGMVRGAIEAPIYTLFAVLCPLVYLDLYGLDLWTVAGNPLFFAGVLLAMSGLLGLKIAQRISRKVLGPVNQGELHMETGESGETYNVECEETLAEKRP